MGCINEGHRRQIFIIVGLRATELTVGGKPKCAENTVENPSRVVCAFHRQGMGCGGYLQLSRAVRAERAMGLRLCSFSYWGDGSVRSSEGAKSVGWRLHWRLNVVSGLTHVPHLPCSRLCLKECLGRQPQSETILIIIRSLFCFSLVLSLSRTHVLEYEFSYSMNQAPK